MLFVGFDPAGQDRFGVAALVDEGAGPRVAASPRCVAAAVEALEWVEQLGEPIALAIDAPLTWSLAVGGVRPQDAALRERFPAARLRVMSVNSLFGAVAAQGPAVALAAHARWPDVVLAEAHPKLTLIALGVPAEAVTDTPAATRRFASATGIDVARVEGPDELDALVAAYAGWAGWKSDPRWEDLNTLAGTESLVWPCGRGVKYPFPREHDRGR